MRKPIFGKSTYNDEEALAYGNLNDLAEELGEEFEKLLVPSRESSLAMTNLEQALMWASKSIRVNGVRV